MFLSVPRSVPKCSQVFLSVPSVPKKWLIYGKCTLGTLGTLIFIIYIIYNIAFFDSTLHNRLII